MTKIDELFKRFTDDELIIIIKEYPYFLSKLSELSEKVQLAAVYEDSQAIEHIKVPTEKVQLKAVEKDGTNIYYIKNPTEKVQLIAVKDSAYNISFINNPSEKIQIEAINNINYHGHDWNFMKKYIKSEKALKLYLKLKKAHGIIK
jgi:hypothetical protein